MSSPLDEPTDRASQIQQEYLEENLPLVFSAYDEALEEMSSPPVVFLLDCEDEIGSQVARAWLGDAAVEDAVSCYDEGQTALFAYAFPFDESSAEVPKVFPYLALSSPILRRRGGFLAVVVAEGGASVFTVPFSARTDH